MRTRLLALALAVCAAVPASAAAPKPQITDPSGDSRVPSAGLDIVSATFSTAGTTAKVGKKTVYTPTKLIVAVTYAGPVSEDPYVTHQVQFSAPGCDDVYLELYGGGGYSAAGCLEDQFAFSTAVSGNTLTFTVPFASIGKQYLKTGASLTGLTVYTAAGDPLMGFETNEVIGGSGLVDGAVDIATTSAAYKIA